MANAFTASNGWRFGGTEGKTFLRQLGTLVIDTTATGGATAGDLPASMFNLNQITGPVQLTKSDDGKVYVGVPSYDAGSLLILGGASDAPQDLPNATYAVVIDGL
jgi:hypothetical protein